MSIVTKLSSANYLTWSTQVKALLKGYDLLKFIDGTALPPATTLVNNIEVPNPAFTHWIRQDSLLYSSLIGAIDVSLQALITTSHTTHDAWITLAGTYAKPTRGHIKQLKSQLKSCVKGTHSIDEYMRLIKTKADALALLGNPVDHEDLTDTILAGLPDDYRSVIDSVQNRDTPIQFEELHEKLLNREIALDTVISSSSPLPMTAHYAQHKPRTEKPPYQQTPAGNQNHSYRNNTSGFRNTRPYLGKCQACGIKGHSAQRCPTYRLVNQSSGSPQTSNGNQWNPKAYAAQVTPPATQNWLLDSGASHHITSDLANLSLHSPYTGGEEVLVGNGGNLPITHTGSSSLPCSSRPLSLTNVLCVPQITKNLVSVQQLCTDNDVSVEFFHHNFR